MRIKFTPSFKENIVFGIADVNRTDVVGFLAAKQQIDLLQKQLSRDAANIIRERTSRGIGLGNIGGRGGLARPLAGYSRKPLFIPNTRVSREEPSGKARKQYDSIMGRVSAKVEMYNPEDLVGGSRQVNDVGRKRGRKWTLVESGYMQLKNLAGMKPSPSNMMFTGKMMADVRAKVTIIEQQAAKQILALRLENMLKAPIRFANSRADGGGYRQSRYHFEGNEAFQKIGGGSLDIKPKAAKEVGASTAFPFYEVAVSFGFATKRSMRIAEWLQTGRYAGGKTRKRSGARPPRIFMGFSSEDQRVFQGVAARAFSSALNDSRFKEATRVRSEWGSSPSPTFKMH
jgi:hypothetical protein